MKLKFLLLLAFTVAPAWAVQAVGFDVPSVLSDASAVVAAGVGLMATIARRRTR
jgi:glucose dehydrogenase